jgi:hypothetical protein
MTASRNTTLEFFATVLVLLMVLLQAGYALYGYTDPSAFSTLRGTPLHSIADSDWVRIYASRTAFVALIVGLLLYRREYRLLVWASLFGGVMPATDAALAWQAQAANSVVIKHLVTLVYLLVTALVLHFAAKRSLPARPV